MFCAIICSDISLLGALRQEQEKWANRSVTRWGSTWPTPFHSSDTSTCTKPISKWIWVSEYPWR